MLCVTPCSVNDRLQVRGDGGVEIPDQFDESKGETDCTASHKNFGEGSICLRLIAPDLRTNGSFYSKRGTEVAKIRCKNTLFPFTASIAACYVTVEVEVCPTGFKQTFPKAVNKRISGTVNCGVRAFAPLPPTLPARRTATRSATRVGGSLLSVWGGVREGRECLKNAGG